MIATYPTGEQLAGLPVIGTTYTWDLRVQTEARRDFGTVHVWTARTGLADGEPFPCTVYVEVYDADRTHPWVDLGHYDGDDPPESLAGYSPADLGLDSIATGAPT